MTLEVMHSPSLCASPTLKKFNKYSQVFVTMISEIAASRRAVQAVDVGYKQTTHDCGASVEANKCIFDLGMDKHMSLFGSIYKRLVCDVYACVDRQFERG